jgi:hypothetical protein
MNVEDDLTDLHQIHLSRLHLYPGFVLHVPNLDVTNIKERKVNMPTNYVQWKKRESFGRALRTSHFIASIKF